MSPGRQAGRFRRVAAAANKPVRKPSNLLSPATIMPAAPKMPVRRRSCWWSTKPRRPRLPRAGLHRGSQAGGTNPCHAASDGHVPRDPVQSVSGEASQGGPRGRVPEVSPAGVCRGTRGAIRLCRYVPHRRHGPSAPFATAGGRLTAWTVPRRYAAGAMPRPAGRSTARCRRPTPWPRAGAWPMPSSARPGTMPNGTASAAIAI